MRTDKYPSFFVVKLSRMEKLAKEVLQGKKGAATRFYRKYAPELRRYLELRLPTRDDAQEVLQDVFVAAFDSLQIFAGKSSVKTWLMSIARHETADFYRKRYVRQAVMQTAKLFDGVAADLGTPEFEMRKKEVRERFEKALSSLNEKYRQVLILRYELGLSVKEVAERMEMSFKATESMIYRSRMALMSAYESYGT